MHLMYKYEHFFARFVSFRYAVIVVDLPWFCMRKYYIDYIDENGIELRSHLPSPQTVSVRGGSMRTIKHLQRDCSLPTWIAHDFASAARPWTSTRPRIQSAMIITVSDVGSIVFYRRTCPASRKCSLRRRCLTDRFCEIKREDVQCVWRVCSPSRNWSRDQGVSRLLFSRKRSINSFYRVLTE